MNMCHLSYCTAFCMSTDGLVIATEAVNGPWTNNMMLAVIRKLFSRDVMQPAKIRIRHIRILC